MIQLPAGVGGGRAGLAVLTARARPVELRLRGRAAARLPLRMPSAAAQCGWATLLPLPTRRLS
jgi:hypothetical protein